MAGGILAHLGRRLTRQQEVLATEGIAYLLQNSPACSVALKRLAFQAGCSLPNVIAYRPEIVGDDLERPDVVGFDENNTEVAILEGKFYAGLTDNQPNSYLARLAAAGGGLLLFVVPDLRVPRLWKAIKDRASADIDVGQSIELAGSTVYAEAAGNVTLMMTSWRELLDTMMVASRAAAEDMTADIFQLQVLCDRIEGEAFLPFGSDELSSLMQPIRHRDLCNLVDAIVEKSIVSNHISREGLNATPQRNGYIRYVWLGAEKHRFGASLGLNYELWHSSGEGPLWLSMMDADALEMRPPFQRVAARLGLTVLDPGNKVSIALPLAAGLEFPELVEKASGIVQSVVDELRAPKSEI
tara:strand:+ start:43926 stop:44990 length:1065 start_codon:yes stop_codon:yes gene_type:complete